MHALMVLTIGLQYGWESFAWIATIPPFVMVILFKAYINKVFHRPFRYYTPTEEELRAAKIHSDRADVKGNRLEKRFGHPALHAELFTPMLHANMMPLLAEVYKGRINHESAKVQEYGGQKLDAQIVPGGLRIAAVEQVSLICISSFILSSCFV
jgi:calcium permeable stress-gated cation channel